MAGKNRNRYNNNKKKKGSKKPPAQPLDLDLEQIISKADMALETSSNMDQAMQLYQYAAHTLRQELQNQATHSTEDDVDGKIATVLLLVRVLSKMGEARVSIGDQENGKLHFQEGFTILGEQYKFNSDPTNQKGSENDENNLVQKAQWHEAAASLCLYLGQLSTEQDALASYEKAILRLNECVSTLEEAILKDKNSRDDRDHGTNDCNNDNNNGGAGEASMINMDEKDEEENLESTLVQIRQQLAGAHCSVAELYLTDLCYEPDAEEKCECHLQTALEVETSTSTTDANNTAESITHPPDAAQAMANFRLCQNRGLDAIPYIFDAYSRMKVGCEAMANLVGLGRNSRDDENSNNDRMMKMIEGETPSNTSSEAMELKEDALKAAETLPGFEFRCQTAKILLECAKMLEQQSEQGNTTDEQHNAKDMEQRSYCIEAAIQVLGSLLSENDEVVEIWYLLGCAFASTIPKNDEASRYYWETALTMLTKIKTGMEGEVSMMGDSGDDDMAAQQGEIDDLTSKIEEVTQKLAELQEVESISMDES